LNPKNLIIGFTLMVGCILSFYITMSETDRLKNPDNNITSTSMKIANRGVERITLKDGYSRIGNLQGVVPDAWMRENPSNSMRLAQFNISDKSKRCELIVFSGIGGSVDANLNRWLGQFLDSDKKRMTDYSTVRNEKIHELEITFAYTAGIYLKSGMGNRGPTVEKPNYGLLAAIVRATNETYYFKCTGPKKTLDNYINSFETFIRSLELL
tara:strand:- start:2120 stop:2752 length:633 start_codon:yes stop_codon:yes gene_type:complete